MILTLEEEEEEARWRRRLPRTQSMTSRRRMQEE
jgi:hypothetical protein